MKLFPNRVTENVRDWMFWWWMDIRVTGQAPYLTRLYIVQTPWFGIKLHWFGGPDPDRDCHDHPWWFLSWVLRGGYAERRQVIAKKLSGTVLLEEYTTLRRRWSWCFRSSTAVHSIIQVEPRTMTLIINGPKVRTWGFWVPTHGNWFGTYHFVLWREYLGLPSDKAEV